MTAPKFDHLKSLSVGSTARAEYVFYGIPSKPKLYVRPATEANKPFLNAILRQQQVLRRMHKGKLTGDALQAARDQDYAAYSQYVVEGWDEKSVLDSAGRPVLFSAEDCEAFLRAIPTEMFDDLRAFCGDPDSFREVPEVSEKEIEELAKN